MRKDPYPVCRHQRCSLHSHKVAALYTFKTMATQAMGSYVVTTAEEHCCWYIVNAIAVMQELRYFDGPRCTVFEIMLSLSRKIRIIVASSWMVTGVSGLHCSNRKPALTANS